MLFKEFYDKRLTQSKARGGIQKGTGLDRPNGVDDEYAEAGHSQLGRSYSTKQNKEIRQSGSRPRADEVKLFNSCPY